MKIGKVVNSNSKGQIVIPKEYRELFGIVEDSILTITPKETGLFIQPIQSVVPKVPSKTLYSEILAATVGSWNRTYKKTQDTNKRKLELKASIKRKKTW